MFKNFNITEILEGRGTLKQDTGPSCPTLGCRSPPGGFGGRGDTNPTPPTPFGRFSLPGSWFPAGSSPSPGHGAHKSPGNSSPKQTPTRAAEPTPKQLNPHLSPVPHLTWGHLGTPPPWAAPSTASTVTPELLQQEKKKSLF